MLYFNIYCGFRKTFCYRLLYPFIIFMRYGNEATDKITLSSMFMLFLKTVHILYIWRAQKRNKRKLKESEKRKEGLKNVLYY